MTQTFAGLRAAQGVWNSSLCSPQQEGRRKSTVSDLSTFKGVPYFPGGKVYGAHQCLYRTVASPNTIRCYLGWLLLPPAPSKGQHSQNKLTVISSAHTVQTSNRKQTFPSFKCALYLYSLSPTGKKMSYKEICEPIVCGGLLLQLLLPIHQVGRETGLTCRDLEQDGQRKGTSKIVAKVI